jgi:hypothetical protein
VHCRSVHVNRTDQLAIVSGYSHNVQLKCEIAFDRLCVCVHSRRVCSDVETGKRLAMFESMHSNNINVSMKSRGCVW